MGKIAILILAHKSPHQLCGMVRALGSRFFDFYVHVDSKSDITAFIAEAERMSLNITFVSNRHDTQLIDFSLVDATMETIKSAVGSGNKYMYYALLTGQDYPVKSPSYIFSHLRENYPTCYIDMYGCDEATSRGVCWTDKIGRYYFSQRIRRIMRSVTSSSFYYSPKGKLIKLFAVIYDRIMTKLKYVPRKVIAQMGYTYSAGSHFWILPDKAVTFLLERYSTGIKLNDVFKHILAPEESYFQTVLSAYPGLLLPENIYGQFSNPDDAMDNPALRLIKWYENGIRINEHPGIWKACDYDYIRQSKALFARKFEENADDDIIRLIDSRIIGKDDLQQQDS